jgi:hypothetical protein
LPGFFIDDSASIPTLAIGQTNQVEWEYGLRVDRTAVQENDVLNFRVEHDDLTDLATYTVVPSVVIGHGKGGVTGPAGGIRQ